MNIYIALHQSCANLDADGYIPVLSEQENDPKETYLSLDSSLNPNSLTIGQGGGRILAKEALHIADRISREDSPETDAESYTARGQDIAESLCFSSAIEYLAAWCNEDRKQSEFCRDIHAVLSLEILEKLPQWIRLDLFSILESEAMKQVFAKRYLVAEKSEHCKIPHELKAAIQNNADDKTDALISKLLSETMQKPPVYSRSAFDFLNQSKDRYTAFQALSRELIK